MLTKEQIEILEYLHQIRNYLESLMYSDRDSAWSGQWYCLECVRLIRDLNGKSGKLNHDNICKLNELLNETIQKIDNLERGNSNA